MRTGAAPTVKRVVSARSVALDALTRIRNGAYANLVVPGILASGAPSALSDRDRHLATHLTYGTTRMRRACDHLVDRFLRPGMDLEPAVRDVLRLGAYQLAFLGMPAHAAVGETVSLAPERARGLVNAVLRKVASDPLDPSDAAAWPDEATRLSYPDWLVARLERDLGSGDAHAALVAMDVPAEVHERADGYTQDPASLAVVALVGAVAGETVLDLCAAPGGKATALAASGARVVAADIDPGRARLIVANNRRLVRGGAPPVGGVVCADGGFPPFRRGAFDRILVDAPCSGLGVLRRRPDARWRILPEHVDALALLQRRLIDAALDLAGPSSVVVFSACTLTLAETLAHDERLAIDRPTWSALSPRAEGWEPVGRGVRMLPQAHGTDGMYALVLHQD